MKKVQLTREELELIRKNEKSIGSVTKSIDKVRQFKEGDYVIAYRPPWSDDEKPELVKNTYGATKKFKVVKVDDNGVPYMKELNKSGNPVGGLTPSIEFHYDDFEDQLVADPAYIFEMDPEYVDATIMDDQANYDPLAVVRQRSEEHKQIAKHNKACKLDCNDSKAKAIWLSALKVGDVLWRSEGTAWVVSSVKPVPMNKNTKKFDHYARFITMRTDRGIEVEYASWDFTGKAFYKDRPKSYRGLKDPK